ncbi:unnamed protein product [Schistosoma curassoni]|uniref:Uncharacterized protein n=1 Tax=Schistosoma curassoni TaxID=6186 RepID=A0A183JJH8_9TREM|nr:unnamed protein product [Schistosoma curassoni]
MKSSSATGGSQSLSNFKRQIWSRALTAFSHSINQSMHNCKSDGPRSPRRPPFAPLPRPALAPTADLALAFSSFSNISTN